MLGIVHERAFADLLFTMGRFPVTDAPQRQILIAGEFDHWLPAVVVPAPGIDGVHEAIALDAARIGGEKLKPFYFRGKLPRSRSKPGRHPLCPLRKQVA